MTLRQHLGHVLTCKKCGILVAVAMPDICYSQDRDPRLTRHSLAIAYVYTHGIPNTRAIMRKSETKVQFPPLVDRKDILFPYAETDCSERGITRRHPYETGCRHKRLQDSGSIFMHEFPFPLPTLHSHGTSKREKTLTGTRNTSDRQ